MYAVEFSDVSKRYGALTIIEGLDLRVDEGSFCALLGPSGCGKSTMLRMVAGLEAVSGGTIRIGDRDVTRVEPAARGVAMVFQNYALYPHLDVADNITFSLSLAGVSKVRRREAALAVARTLQLEPLLDRRPAQLSGGQRQRVAIGRALVRDPKVFLFDEPLSNLDALLRGQMRLELARLHAELGRTTIYVTHDQVEAMTLADRIVVLDRGAIRQVGTPFELYNAPANRFVAGFIGSPTMNFLPGTARSVPAGVRLTLPGGTTVDLPPRSLGAFAGERPVVLGVRPEDLAPAPAGAPGLPGRISVVEYLGNTTHVHVDTPAGPVVAEAGTLTGAKAGDTLSLAIDGPKAHLFDETGEALPRAH